MLQIVLVNPEIPQNTGSIARTCAATAVPLHLVGRLGFDISEKAVRRAGLDYWPYVSVTRHETWQDYLSSARPATVWAVSKFGRRLYTEPEFGAGDALVFGSETKGLGQEFLAQIAVDHVLRLPMACPHVRSLNLSNAVAVVLYEALRQLRAKGLWEAE